MALHARAQPETRPAPLAGLEAVLFDFGGTLDGDGVHWSTRFREAYSRAGLELPLARFEPAFAEADRRIAADPRCVDQGLEALLAEQVRQQLALLRVDDAALARAAEADLLAQAELCLARSRALLARLRPHFRLGVVSNFTGALERVCRDAGLRPFLDVLVDSALVGVRKPDPEIVRVAVRWLGCAPAACLMVGDSFERDVVPARLAGVHAVWLRGPRPRPCPDAALPDAILETLADLPALLGLDA